MRGADLNCFVALRQGAVVAALLFAARVGWSQEIRGTVRDSTAGVPLAGATAQLLDSDRHVVARALTGQDGRYRLEVTQAVSWLQVLRIGFRPRLRQLSGREAIESTIDVALVRLPAQLEPVLVSDNSKCPRRKDAGMALALWEDARAGLLATVVARESRPAAMKLIGFTRVMDRRGGASYIRSFDTGHIDHQLVRLLDTADARRSFVAVFGAPDFTRLGFMTEDSVGRRTFFGPDADVLLDPDFAESHCFSLADGSSEHKGETGLAFEPAPGDGRDTLVEVQGTLWIDRRVAALKTLEFQYTNLEPAADSAKSGGVVSFLPLANGVTLIDRWSIRFAVLRLPATMTRMDNGMAIPFHPRRPNNFNASVGAVYVGGGQLVSAEWPDGFSWHAKLATVTGHVADSTGAPVAGVEVLADSTDYNAISDVRGDFLIRDVLPGPYRWFAAPPKLGLLGARVSEYRDIDVGDETSPRVVLVAHTGESGRDFFCHGKQPPRSVAFVGQLLYADKLPAANLDVRISWRYQEPIQPTNPVYLRGERVDRDRPDSMVEGSGARAAARHLDVTTNDAGRFKMCGVPLDGTWMFVHRGNEQLFDGGFELPSRESIQGVKITLPLAPRGER